MTDHTPHDLDELKVALQRSPLLRGLMEVAPDIMQKTLVQEDFLPNTVLFREGDQADRAYVIWRGKLRIQHEMGHATPLVLRECGPGDVVGEVSLFDSQPRSASVIVTEESRLISLSRQDLHRLLAQKPEAAIALLQTLSHRLRTSDEVLIQASHSIDFLSRRIAGLDMDEEEKKDAPGKIPSPVATHQQSGLSQAFYDLTETAMALADGLKVLKRQAAMRLDEDSRDMLNLIDGQANRLAHTLERIRLIEVLESGEAYLNEHAVMVGALADKIASQFAPAAREKQVKFEFSVDPGLPSILADEELLAEAFRQLFSNAVRFSPYGGVINFEMSQSPKKKELHITLTNEGPDISEEYRELIFEPFIRTPDDPGRGYGLGLALCRAIIQAHQGSISVVSAPEGGSQFVITLPFSIGG